MRLTIHSLLTAAPSGHQEWSIERAIAFKGAVSNLRKFELEPSVPVDLYLADAGKPFNWQGRKLKALSGRVREAVQAVQAFHGSEVRQ